MIGPEGPQVCFGLAGCLQCGDKTLQSENQSAGTPRSLAQGEEFGFFEPYVDEDVISRFLRIAPRRVLEMAREGELPSHPLGSGMRKTWRFLISEIDAHLRGLEKPVRGTMAPAVPRARKRSN